MALGAGGKLEPRSKTLYSAGDRPVLTSILGLPVFPWTPERAFVMGRRERHELPPVQPLLRVDQAQSVGELDAIERKYQLPTRL
jgi:acyl-homoserine-lactone acylase